MPEVPSETHISTKANRGLVWAAASQTIVAISDLLSQAICVAVWLGDERFGIVMMVVPLYTILDAVTEMGGVAQSLVQHDTHTPERLSTVFWFNTFVALALVGVSFLAGPFYARFQGYPIVHWLLVLYGGKLLAQNFCSIPIALLRKEMAFEQLAKIRTAAYLAESIARIAFCYFGFALWSYVLAAIAKAVVFAVLLQWKHPFWPRFVFRWREVRDDVRFGVRSALSSLLYYTYTNLDYIVVSYYFGAKANGAYSLAFWIVLEAVKTIANVIIDVAYPTFSKLHGKGDRPALINEFIKLTRLSLIAILPFVVLIMLIVPDFLAIAYGGGAKWTDDQLSVVATACRILCFVGTLRAVSFIGPPLLDGIGRPGLTLRYTAVAAVVVPLGFVLSAAYLGPWLGTDDQMLSVPIAWAVAYPLAFIVLSYLVAESIDLPIARYAKSSFQIVGCAAGGYALGYAVSLALPRDAHTLRLVVVGAASVAGTLALLAKWQKITPASIKASLG